MLGLTYVRQLYNLSMEELAKQVGVSKQTVSKWENSKTALSTDRINQLKELFGLREDYFSRELDDIDKLKIQKMKIENEIGDVVDSPEKVNLVLDSDILSIDIYFEEGIDKIYKSLGGKHMHEAKNIAVIVRYVGYLLYNRPDKIEFLLDVLGEMTERYYPEYFEELKKLQQANNKEHDMPNFDEFKEPYEIKYDLKYEKFTKAFNVILDELEKAQEDYDKKI